MLILVNVGPFFNIYKLQSNTRAKLYTSRVYDNGKKTDSSVTMVLDRPQPVCGDVLIELCNKHKMMKKVVCIVKVHRGYLSLYYFVMLRTTV